MAVVTVSFHKKTISYFFFSQRAPRSKILGAAVLQTLRLSQGGMGLGWAVGSSRSLDGPLLMEHPLTPAESCQRPHVRSAASQAANADRHAFFKSNASIPSIFSRPHSELVQASFGVFG